MKTNRNDKALKRELRMLGEIRIHHPSLLPYIPSIYTKGSNYYVMEQLYPCCEFYSRRDRNRRNDDILKAVNILHNEGVIHGDLMLRNIMCRKDGHIVFIDFEKSVMIDGEFDEYCATELQGLIQHLQKY